MKETPKKSPPSDLNRIRHIESQHYSSRGLNSSIESGIRNTYEWFEDEVIKKNASVEFGFDAMGLESITIKVLIQDPNDGKKEVVYYTTDKREIIRIKGILDGKTLVIDESGKK